MRKSLWIAAIAVSVVGIGAAAAADIATLERELEKARNEAPLVIQSFVAVDKPARYYGDYQPRKDTVYRQGEEMHFYAEPKNLVFLKNAKDMYSPKFDIDLEITGPDGKSFKKPKFLNFTLDTRSRIQDLYLNLDVSLTGAPAGKYNVKFVIHDGNSKKTAAFAQDVTIK